MCGTMEGIHHISRKNFFGGNNSLPTLGLLLVLDIREFLHLGIFEITDTPEIRPDFQMELSDYAGDAKETLFLYYRK